MVLPRGSFVNSREKSCKASSAESSTLKYATQKHYRYMLDVHLNPAFSQALPLLIDPNL